MTEKQYSTKVEQISALLIKIGDLTNDLIEATEDGIAEAMRQDPYRGSKTDVESEVKRKLLYYCRDRYNLKMLRRDLSSAAMSINPILRNHGEPTKQFRINENN